MRKAIYAGAATLAAITVTSAIAAPATPTRQAATTKLAAFLTVNQEIPAPKGARGSGTFTATVTWRRSAGAKQTPLARFSLRRASASPPSSSPSPSRATPTGSARLCPTSSPTPLRYTESGGLVDLRVRRGEKSRSRATGGAGIGLAIVHELVRGHDGRIDVESRPGVGSTFRVSLPALDARASRERQNGFTGSSDADATLSS